jgi:hypothetical protein
MVPNSVVDYDDQESSVMSRFVRNLPHVSIQLEEQCGIHVPKVIKGLSYPMPRQTNDMSTDKGYAAGHCRVRILVVGNAAYEKCSWMRMCNFRVVRRYEIVVCIRMFCEII